MKTFSIYILFFLFALQISAQFTDNFTDGNFTANPIWNGNTSDFQITANQLQLNAPSVSASKYLSTPSQAINNGSWEFKFRLTVNPSGSNFSRIYLVSNTSNLSGNVNGYFVMIGGSSDEISLYKQSGSTITEIIDGRNGVLNVSSVNTKIKVTRTSSGSWQLFSDTTSGFTSYISEGMINDNTFTQSLFFGVFCKFTSTRSDKFYFDDFVVTGTPIVDLIPPLLDSVKVISSTQLDVLFNEPVSLATAQNITNYTGNNGIGNPIIATRDASNLAKVHLTFSSAFPIGIYHTLAVANVEDIAGNSIVNTTRKFIYFIPAIPVYHDVVINEILPDPNPAISLPEAEFVEIYNTSTSKIFDLSGWEIGDASSGSSLGEFVLLPNSYVVICANSDLPKFSIYPNVIGVSSLSLSNSGDEIYLKDNAGNKIDFMQYSIDFFGGTDKKNGGWSLELVNPNLNCFNTQNWKPSTNFNGGTIGIKNSVYDTIPDTQSPELKSVFAISNSQIEITFSETIDTNSLLTSSFLVTNGIAISSFLINSTIGNSVTLTVSPALDSGKIYTLSISNLQDCEGNISNPSADFVLANKPQIGDLIINEILFNPVTGGQDYVEIYNNSDRYIDLKGCKIGNDDNGNPGNLKTVESNNLLYPKDYLVLTTDKYSVLNQYFTRNEDKIIEIPSLPTFSNDEGVVYLILPSGDVSDKLEYTEDMHFGLLRNKDGVSLERLDFNRPTSDKSNWHSAAESIGFGTPGVKNSQFNSAKIIDNILSISPEIFSPDNDGFEDVLTLSYSFNKPGFVGNITIYDAKGRLIKYLIKNELLATKGVFIWDGLTDNGTKARIGRYIVFFEYFDLDGNVKSIKKTCVLGHKFNN